jgi:hypothetical protein
MARIGLPYSVFAPIASEPENAPPVYDTAVRFLHPIEANISYERADNPLYGGDVIAENDNSIVGGELSFNHTHLTPVERAAVLGHEKIGTAPNDHYVESGEPSPDGGFGYVTAEVESGTRKYYGFWIYKTQLSMAEDNATTKANSIEWQTPTVSGPIMGVFIDTTGKARFRAYQAFDSYADAKAWVDDKAGIETVATPTASPEEGAVEADTPVTLACATDEAEIYYTINGATPTTSSTKYTVPITISAEMTIKAFAVKTGMNNSTILTATYTIQE